MDSTKLIIILVVVGVLGIGALFMINSLSSGTGGLLGGLLGGLIPDSIAQPLGNMIGRATNLGLTNINKGLTSTEALMSGDIGKAITNIPIFGGFIPGIF